MSQYDAYRQTIKQTAAPRDVEYRLLVQVTSALSAAKEQLAESAGSPKAMSSVMDALNWNNQVWDAFVEDVGTEGNALPRELRAAIVSLGIWVSRETNDVVSGNGDIDSLISVNQAIMRGLNPDRSAAAPAGDGPAPDPAAPRRAGPSDLA
ncbi:MAG: flagellar biosynthesis regulator FlaF [Alphaproteobacteria bacterium]|jgi:flagellar protein FlaF|nr:flagellar biosynthesis regulator FlaF [Alphaproteobacteria bacterium]